VVELFGSCLGSEAGQRKRSRHSAGDVDVDSKAERDEASSRRPEATRGRLACLIKLWVAENSAVRHLFGRDAWSGLFRRTEPAGPPAKAWRVRLTMGSTKKVRNVPGSRGWGGRWRRAARSGGWRVERAEQKSWRCASDGVCEKGGKLERDRLVA
jgi:hypothetical protein